MACFGKCGRIGMIAGMSQINGLAIAIFFFLKKFYRWPHKEKEDWWFENSFSAKFVGNVFWKAQVLKDLFIFFLINESIYIYLIM